MRILFLAARLVSNIFYKALVIYLTGVLLITGCSSPPQASTPLPSPTHTEQISPTLTPTTAPTGTPVPTKSPTTRPTVEVCSPLPGYTLDRINEAIVNPFNPPPAGSDNPHQGIDIAELLGDSHIAVTGEPIQAVLAGQIAGVINNRFPYGNALILETRLDNFTNDWGQKIEIPTPAPTIRPLPALTCPTGIIQSPQHAGRSLYLLYAHMLEQPGYLIGDSIRCGDTIGKIGQSGNALNPHLHLELRVGPSGMVFPSMAHYDSSATPEEMEVYCLWRVTEMFQLIDPLKILRFLPQER